MGKRNFYDFSDFTNPIKAIELFEKAIQEGMDFNELPGPVFLAKVLTPPMPLNANQMSAILHTPAAAVGPGGLVGTGGATDSAQMVTVIFKGRIDQLHNFLPDPCDVAFSKNPRKVNRLRRKHTDFVATTAVSDMPIEGDIVKVQLKLGAHSWDLQYGQYLGMYEEQGAAWADDVDSPCHSAMSTFIKGIRKGVRSYSPPLAGKYLPDGRGIENGMLPGDILVTVDPKYTMGGGQLLKDVVEDYNNLAKAFVEANGYKLKLTQGYRPYEEQVGLARTKPDLAAKPGTSNHGWGLAADIQISGMLPADAAAGVTSAYETGVYKWLFVNAPKYNFENPSWAVEGASCTRCKEEPWHWEYTKKHDLIR